MKFQYKRFSQIRFVVYHVDILIYAFQRHENGLKKESVLVRALDRLYNMEPGRNHGGHVSESYRCQHSPIGKELRPDSLVLEIDVLQTTFLFEDMHELQ